MTTMRRGGADATITQGDCGGGGGGNGRLRNSGDEQQHLTVLAMDDNKTTGDWHSMDAGMDFGKEKARQRRCGVLRQRWTTKRVGV